MTETEEKNREVVRSYLKALEAGVVGEKLAGFFTPDVVQIEYPSLLVPEGGRSDLETILVRAEKGRRFVSDQRYQVLSETIQEKRVSIEAVWTGKLLVEMDTIPAGTVLKAYTALFFELQEGRIRAQRNYDCFEPW